jgi:hypothetical protein
MDLLHDLICPIQSNSDMMEEQLFDKLVDLGIFKEVIDGKKMVTNAPLLCLPKAGQPGNIFGTVGTLPRVGRRIL